MDSSCDCLYRLANAYKLWCHQQGLWTWATFRVWDAIITAAHQAACRLAAQPDHKEVHMDKRLQKIVAVHHNSASRMSLQGEIDLKLDGLLVEGWDVALPPLPTVVAYQPKEGPTVCETTIVFILARQAPTPEA